MKRMNTSEMKKTSNRKLRQRKRSKKNCPKESLASTKLLDVSGFTWVNSSIYYNFKTKFTYLDILVHARDALEQFSNEHFYNQYCCLQKQRIINALIYYVTFIKNLIEIREKRIDTILQKIHTAHNFGPTGMNKGSVDSYLIHMHSVCT